MPKGIYPRRKTLKSKFWSRINKFGFKHPQHGHCWEFSGMMVKGYGKFLTPTGRVSAHRFSWEEANGPIPTGKMVLHKCDNRRCVRPKHLFLGDALANNQDMRSKGRAACCKGINNPKHKLTETQVLEIRAKFVRKSERRSNAKILSKEYGVSVVMIWLIVKNKNWSHLTPKATSCQR